MKKYLLIVVTAVIIALGASCTVQWPEYDNSGTNSTTTTYTNETEPNNTIVSADDVEIGTDMTAQLSTGDEDWFEFVCMTGSRFFVETKPAAGHADQVDTLVTVYDGDDLVTENDNDGDGDYSKTQVFTAMSTGEISIRVRAQGNDTGWYEIVVVSQN